MNTNNTICHLPDPEPSQEPVSADALLADIADIAERLSRHVALPKSAPDALALWVLHTYAFHLRDISTYLGIESLRTPVDSPK